MALGVPGSLSNRPPAPPAKAAPADAQAQAQAGGGANNGNDATARRNATTRQYAYDRNIRQIRHSRGQLARLNVAVVLNNAAAPGGAGTWPAEELTRIEGILRNGLGINATRGDQLAVSALAFSPRPVPQPWWQERDTLIDYGTPLAWLVAALLGYLLLARPLLRSVQARLAPVPAPPRRRGEDRSDEPLSSLAALQGPDAGTPQPAALGAPQMPVVPLLQDYDLPPPGSPVDVMVNHLRVLAAKEPERVAEVVKQWVQKNARPQ